MEPVRIVRVRRRAVGVQIVTNVAGLVDDGGWVRSRGRAAVPPPVRVRGRRVRWVRHHAVRVDIHRKVMTSVAAVVVVVAFAVRRRLADIRGIAMGAAVVPRRQKTAQVVSVGRRRHRRRRLPHPFVGGFHPRRRMVEITRVPPPPPSPSPLLLPAGVVVRRIVNPARLPLVPILLHGTRLLPGVAHDARDRAALGRHHPAVAIVLEPVHVLREEDVVTGPVPLALAAALTRRGAVGGLLIHVTILVRFCPWEEEYTQKKMIGCFWRQQYDEHIR